MPATFTPPLAPLTTIFTPPCPTTWLLTTTKVPSQFPPFPTTAPASCDLPSWDNYISARGFEYYSPAICPDGFYVGPSCIVTNPRTGDQGFPEIQGGETAAYCIPNGHTCTSDTTDFRGGVWGVSRTASENGAEVTVGPAIQIRWRESDLLSLETDPLTPGPKVTQPSSTEPAPPAETTTPDPTTERSTSTSTSSLASSSTTSTSTSSSPTTTSSTTSIPGFGTISSKDSRETSVSDSSKSSKSSSSLSSPAPIIGSSSLAPTQESEPSTTQETTPSSASVSPSSGQTASAQRDGGGGTSVGTASSHFTVAAIVLTAILITIIVAYATYSTLHRYRRYRAGEAPSFFLFEIKAWVRNRVRALRRLREKDIYSQDDYDEKAGDARDRRKRKLPDAELGTEGPLPELGDDQAFGTKENPAELPTVDRSSWRSRVSRILTPRASKHT